MSAQKASTNKRWQKQPHGPLSDTQGSGFGRGRNGKKVDANLQCTGQWGSGGLRGVSVLNSR